jgi:hypothetical protein
VASTPTLQYLQLDPSYDPVFDPAAALDDTYAVAQAILTRLKLFLGEWWEDVTLGFPLYQSVLGQLGSAQGLAAITLLVQQNIAGGPYVTGVADIQVTFANGALAITATAFTQFGPVAVNTAQALNNASLGT